MKIVLTGPSSAPYAREYISNAASTLRKRGHDVFVPHEGGWQAPEHPAEADRFDFEATYEALREADMLMAILDGYTVDDAVAAQIGAFHAHAREGSRPRRIVGFLHDTRVAGWDWTGGDSALTPQIRESIRELGAVYPNFMKALAALETEGV
ncbi:MAG: hypothetical protein AMXMBFR80_28750 [Dehalococcoidia bacterium]